MLASFDNWVPAGHDAAGPLMQLVDNAGIKTDFLPPVIFLGVGALTDFRPLMAAMGPNVAGVIGTAIAAGVFLALLK